MTLISFTFSSLTLTLDPQLAPIPYIDFDISMQKNNHMHLLQDNFQSKIYSFFNHCYEITNPLIMQPMQELLIPKKLHFIWLGSPLPEKYKPLIQSWIDFNPGWECKIWNDADAQAYDFENKDMFNQEANYGAKSDILRYAILEKEGGVYIDVDYECLKNLDTLNHTYHFYIGIQPLDTNYVQLGIGLIGSIPHHPLMNYTIEKLKYNKDVKQIIVKTGPIFFTRCFIEFFGKSGLRDIAFPASYFYPCGYVQRGQPLDEWYKAEAYAVHHWAGSWLSKSAFVPGTFKE
jgi:inositol phosphorylceramide mannosyltransferase catalytic subunit